VDFSLSKEQILFQKSIIDFARKELNDNLIENDEKGSFSLKNWKKCAGMDILSIQCPVKYGGCKEDFLTTVLGIEALSYACKDSGLVHAIATQLCCIILLSLFGNETQKEKHLPNLSKGEKIAAQAITEPEAGSDVLSMQTAAVISGEYYKINGSKTFISNGPLADVIILFAITNPNRRQLGGVSSFIIQKDQKGLRKGEPLDKMGLRTMHNGELFFDDCLVSHDDILGKEGQGMAIFGDVIEFERTILAAAHLGTMQRILEMCIQYGKSRRQFGQPIEKFQSISNKISDMKVNLELGKMMLYKMAWMKDQGRRATLETSIGKLFISESLKKACLEAIQIHGGYGYMKEYEVERELRDGIASTIYSGTSELQRNIISSMAGV